MPSPDLAAVCVPISHIPPDLLLAMVAYYKRAAQKEGREFPALEAERAVLPFGVAWGALEAGALLAYLASCVRR